MQRSYAGVDLERVLGSAPHAVIMVDRDGTVTGWSRGAEQLLGWTADEMVGFNRSKVLSADQVAEAERLMGVVTSGVPLERYVTFRPHKDGHLVPVSTTVTPRIGADGSAVGGMLIARPLESTGFQTMMDMMPTPVFCLDQEGRLLAFNQATTQVLESMSGNVARVGANVFDLMSPGEASGARANVERALSGETFSVVLPYLRDGETRHLEYTFSPNSSGGWPASVLVVSTDVTARIELQDRRDSALRAIADVAELAAYVLDPDLRVLAFSRRAHEVFETTWGTTLERGGSLLDAVPAGAQRDRVAEGLNRALSGETDVEQCWRGAPGERRRWAITRAPFCVEDRIAGVITVAIDTTEFALREAEEAEANVLLEEAIDSARDCIALLSIDGDVVRANAALERLLGTGRGELVGRRLRDLVAKTDAGYVDAAFERLTAGDPVEIHRIGLDPTAGPAVDSCLLLSPLYGSNGDLIGISAVARPLDSAAYYDELTGVFNARGLEEFGRQLLARSGAEGRLSALLRVDVDSLSAINDAFGREIGDIALQDLAVLLASVIDEADVLARVTEDEFAVLTTGVTGPDVEDLAARVRKAAARFNDTGGRPYKLVVSIGAAVSKDTDFDAVFREAGAAMTADKSHRLTDGARAVPPEIRCRTRWDHHTP